MIAEAPLAEKACPLPPLLLNAAVGPPGCPNGIGRVWTTGGRVRYALPTAALERLMVTARLLCHLPAGRSSHHPGTRTMG